MSACAEIYKFLTLLLLHSSIIDRGPYAHTYSCRSSSRKHVLALLSSTLPMMCRISAPQFSHLYHTPKSKWLFCSEPYCIDTNYHMKKKLLYRLAAFWTSLNPWRTDIGATFTSILSGPCNLSILALLCCQKGWLSYLVSWRNEMMKTASSSCLIVCISSYSTAPCADWRHFASFRDAIPFWALLASR